MTLSRFPSLVAIAAALSVGAMIAAPPALAQRSQPKQQQQPAGPQLSSKELAKALQEGLVAMQAKDYVTAKPKLDAAAALAKTPVDKAELAKLRVPMASATSDWANLVPYIQEGLATGLLPADTVKAWKTGLVTAYANLKDNANTMVALRAVVDEYGGTPEQTFAVGQELVKANDPAGVGYVEKGIAAAKAAGKPTEGQYGLLLNAYTNVAKDEAKYYDALAQLVADYPTDNNWKRYIAKAQAAPGFQAAGKDIRIDIYRAALAAGVKLSPSELGNYADETVNKGLPGEAVSALEPHKAELTGTAPATLANANKKSAEDKAGLAKDEANTRAKGTAEAIANLGEAYMSYGDNAKAVDLMKMALTKGIADAGKADIVKLHLGIAQNRSGDKAGAQATWAEIKADNGAAVLAKMWTTISKVKA